MAPSTFQAAAFQTKRVQRANIPTNLIKPSTSSPSKVNNSNRPNTNKSTNLGGVGSENLGHSGGSGGRFAMANLMEEDLTGGWGDNEASLDMDVDSMDIGGWGTLINTSNTSL